MSVILVTSEELETLTGVRGVTEGCEWLFRMHTSVLQWVVVKVGSEGQLHAPTLALILMRTT